MNLNLYCSVDAGSKSNLFIDDTVTEPDETVTALRYIWDIAKCHEININI